VAVPLCIAAFLLRRKIYIHESDTVPGLANRMISKMATKVFYTFPNKKTEDPENKKHIFTGQILNPEIISGLKNLKLDENIYLNVIVIA
jgi:UDP-N-acetylglucosamine--N-acetylmuramyl-(pentapeptide) pyrophosphoryl-undecaprenol N-acetylglucosamine transferase 3